MIERQTDKVSPRLDEQLKHETAALTHGSGVVSRREDLVVEPATADDGVPDPSQRHDIPEHDSIGIDPAAADARTALAVHLIPSVFPADRTELVAAAESTFAGEMLLRWLRTLPDGRQFDNVQDVWVALGGDAELRHT